MIPLGMVQASLMPIRWGGHVQHTNMRLLWNTQPDCQAFVTLSQHHKLFCKDNKLWLHCAAGGQGLMDEQVQHVEVPPVSLALQLLHSAEVDRESQAHHCAL